MSKAKNEWTNVKRELIVNVSGIDGDSIACTYSLMRKNLQGDFGYSYCLFHIDCDVADILQMLIVRLCENEITLSD
jgi:hypothetical protein